MSQLSPLVCLSAYLSDHRPLPSSAKPRRIKSTPNLRPLFSNFDALRLFLYASRCWLSICHWSLCLLQKWTLARSPSHGGSGLSCHEACNLIDFSNVHHKNRTPYSLRTFLVLPPTSSLTSEPSLIVYSWPRTKTTEVTKAFPKTLYCSLFAI